MFVIFGATANRTSEYLMDEGKAEAASSSVTVHNVEEVKTHRERTLAMRSARESNDDLIHGMLPSASRMRLATFSMGRPPPTPCVKHPTSQCTLQLPVSSRNRRKIRDIFPVPVPVRVLCQGGTHRPGRIEWQSRQAHVGARYLIQRSDVDSPKPAS